eukprot:TRINITY_DN2087_c0_g1_i4.p1 TRINITY_DN2087_c0_g1~~TRINITY_DN2087_c0_g1_i4.p1  ORF type:complete len:554 (+),score=152.60 TRINITY_DN2087_c0_g1_i4:82-1662(+)
MGRASLAAAACLLAGWAAADPLADAWFTSSREEVLQEEEVELVGRLPEWLQGSYFKESASVYEEPKRTFLNSFDGFGKVLRWRFPGGGATPTLRARMLQSSWWNDSEATHDIAFGSSLGGVAPPFSAAETRKNRFHPHADNLNVAFWDYGPVVGHHMSISDTCNPAGLQVDPSDLATTEFLWNDSWAKAEYDRFAPAHPMHTVDGTGDTVSIVGRINPAALVGVGKHSFIVYRVVAATGERVQLHTIPTKKMYYFHSLGVTPNYAVFFGGPLRWEVPTLMEGKAAGEAWRWDSDNTTVYLVPLDPSKPVRTFVTDPFFGFHIVNAWEETNGDVTVDLMHVDGLDKDNAMPASLSLDLRDPAKRDSYRPRNHLGRHTLHLDTGRTSYRTVPLDAAGGAMQCPDLPTVNPVRYGTSYCTLWIWAPGVAGRRWTEVGLIKKNMCDEQSLASVWYRPNHWPGEMSFVPAPGATAEDDGLLLSAAHDGDRNATYLLVLNATTMETVAQLYRKSGERRIMGFGIHGRWYPAN